MRCDQPGDSGLICRSSSNFTCHDFEARFICPFGWRRKAIPPPAPSPTAPMLPPSRSEFQNSLRNYCDANKVPYGLLSYTEWRNLDLPTGLGDIEDMLKWCDKGFCFKGREIGPNAAPMSPCAKGVSPSGVECRLSKPPYTDWSMHENATKYTCELNCDSPFLSGGRCKTEDGIRCEDFQVRYICPEGWRGKTEPIPYAPPPLSGTGKGFAPFHDYCDPCMLPDVSKYYTDWHNNPKNSKDIEMLSEYCRNNICHENGSPCRNGLAPSKVECRRVSDQVDHTKIDGQGVYCSLGFGCLTNAQYFDVQVSGCDIPEVCDDYEVRFECPDAWIRASVLPDISSPLMLPACSAVKFVMASTLEELEVAWVTRDPF